MLNRTDHGYWEGNIKNCPSGTLYSYQLDEKIKRPDPASKSQPQSVHGPSEVKSFEFPWTDQQYKPEPLNKWIIYELHVGTFTDKGTFEGATEKLPHLRELGINAIEIMPVAQFPGERNWGYDGVHPFAVQDSYGGISALQNLVDKAHNHGIAIILDVVYNHFGPEGNYLSDYGPYFTGKYQTPWGKALNFDDAYSDAVRNYFIQNALMWLKDFHIDGLRLDAIHAIKDFGAEHFLKALSDQVVQLSTDLKKPKYLIGECDLNDVKYINPPENGGYGIHAQWADEFHHALHSTLTGEKDGYYEDFGEMHHLKKTYADTFVYDGIYSPHRKRIFGNSARNNPPHQFVVFAQNHDQVGNRMLGERLTELISFEGLKVGAAAYILSPHLPFLFMGEEFAEDHPFLYFISHGDPGLVEAVRKGRAREFQAFRWKGEVPDPQSVETFNKCKLNWAFHQETKKRTLFEFYKKLISIRKTHPAFEISDRQLFDVQQPEDQKVISFRWHSAPSLWMILNFDQKLVSFENPYPTEQFNKIFDSSEQEWLGPGSEPINSDPGLKQLNLQPQSIVLFEKV